MRRWACFWHVGASVWGRIFVSAGIRAASRFKCFAWINVRCDPQLRNEMCNTTNMNTTENSFKLKDRHPAHSQTEMGPEKGWRRDRPRRQTNRRQTIQHPQSHPVEMKHSTMLYPVASKATSECNIDVAISKVRLSLALLPYSRQYGQKPQARLKQRTIKMKETEAQTTEKCNWQHMQLYCVFNFVLGSVTSCHPPPPLIQSRFTSFNFLWL
jgi:hypothetical protein